MMPGAGLFLRESLYTKQPPLADSPGTQAVKPKASERPNFFQRVVTERKNSEQKSLERKSFDRRSTARSSTEDVTNTTTFTSLSTVFNFVNYASSVGKVSEENDVFVRLIQRVQQDLDEALRLLSIHAVEQYYDSFPDRWNWIENVLYDAQRALNDIGVYVENVRVSGDGGGTVKMRQKFEWVLGHHQKLLSREHALTICHQSLMVAVRNMQEVEMNRGFQGFEMEGTPSGVYEAPSQPWMQLEDGGIMRSPYSRQRWRLSQRNLSLPSITVSEHEEEKLGGTTTLNHILKHHTDSYEAHSINSTPVELPGSTPEDLADPENWDLYAPPPQNRARTSFDQPRASRISFDQDKPRRSLDQLTTSRPSPEKARPLSILIENATENTRIPGRAPTAKVAKRYQPREVEVRKPGIVKHHSLPSELPSLPTQPSLITELSNWILPGADIETQRTSNGSIEGDTPTSAALSSPDLPTSPASCPGLIQSGLSNGVASRPVRLTPSTSAEKLAAADVVTNALTHISEPPEEEAQPSLGQTLPVAPSQLDQTPSPLNMRVEEGIHAPKPTVNPLKSVSPIPQEQPRNTAADSTATSSPISIHTPVSNSPITRKPVSLRAALSILTPNPAPTPIPAPMQQAQAPPDAPADSPTSIYTSGTIPISLDTQTTALPPAPAAPAPESSTSPPLSRSARVARRGVSRVGTASSETLPPPPPPPTSTPTPTQESNAGVISQPIHISAPAPIVSEKDNDSDQSHRNSSGSFVMSGALPVEPPIPSSSFSSSVSEGKADSAIEVTVTTVGEARVEEERGRPAMPPVPREVSTQPGASQVKRRRAQARRMQLAYGSD